MKLWLISQDVNNDYDTYDSAVVAAPDEGAARNTHPSGADLPISEWSGRYGNWAAPDRVVVVYIGEAAPDRPAGVVCASFNAG